MLLTVNADSTFVTFVELLVNVILSKREMIKVLWEDIETIGYSLNQIPERTVEATVLCSVVAKMKNGSSMSVKHIHVGKKHHNHFVCTHFGLFH